MRRPPRMRGRRKPADYKSCYQTTKHSGTRTQTFLYIGHMNILTGVYLLLLPYISVCINMLLNLHQCIYFISIYLQYLSALVVYKCLLKIVVLPLAIPCFSFVLVHVVYAQNNYLVGQASPRLPEGATGCPTTLPDHPRLPDHLARGCPTTLPEVARPPCQTTPRLPAHLARPPKVPRPPLPTTPRLPGHLT